MVCPTLVQHRIVSTSTCQKRVSTKKIHGIIPLACISSNSPTQPTESTGPANLRSQKSDSTNPIITFDPVYNRAEHPLTIPPSSPNHETPRRLAFPLPPPTQAPNTKRARARALVQDPPCITRVSHSPRPPSVHHPQPVNPSTRPHLRDCGQPAMPSP